MDEAIARLHEKELAALREECERLRGKVDFSEAYTDLQDTVEKLRWEVGNSGKFAQDQEDSLATLRARCAELEALLDSCRTSLTAVAGHSTQPMMATDARGLVGRIRAALSKGGDDD